MVLSKTLRVWKHVVSIAMQKRLLGKYQIVMQPVFPCLVRCEYKVLREQHPLLLQDVIFAACPRRLSVDAQDEVTAIAARPAAPDEIAKQEKNLKVAIEFANELSISNSEWALGIASFESNDKINSVDAWRTLNLCYLLSSSLGSCMRFPPKIEWNVDMEMKLSSLEYGRDSLSTDGLLCPFVRAERLCEQISMEAGYSTTNSILQADHVKTRHIQNLIIDWRAQLFSSNSPPALRMYENIATAYLYECILHTPTNKRSFVGPYVAERLSLTDFSAPAVTPDHIPFLYSLRDACHTALNAVIALDFRDIAYAPIVTFTAKAFYAQWLLIIKLYVAVTAGNIYGAFISAESLQIEHYLHKISEIGHNICAIDPEHVGGKGLQQPTRKIRE
ncbi:hypothetical protein ACEPPN_015078 [Leptodophora sp. 'Broadleaf-Isolate-01']